VQRVRSCRKRQMTASGGTIGLLLAVLLDEPGDVNTGSWGLRRSGAQRLAVQAGVAHWTPAVWPPAHPASSLTLP
jgi:hypothetical protein